MSDLLKTYKSKRNFDVTPEPAEGGEEGGENLSFVIQKHWASRLHYDFRLELDGTMKSWAVPKGPSYDTHDKRMAVHVEDHPISYNTFEGTIPEKQYGAGKVIIWDKGTWHPLGDPRQGYRDGNLKFELRGHKMQGRWVLIRMKGRGEKQEPWLLIKEKDDYARPATEFSVIDEMPDSVKALGMPKAARAAARAGKADAEPKAEKSTAKRAAAPKAAGTAAAKAGAKAPAKAAAESPPKVAANAPAKTAAKTAGRAPAKAAAKAPAKTASNAPAKTAAKTATKTVAKTPARKTATKAAGETGSGTAENTAAGTPVNAEKAAKAAKAAKSPAKPKNAPALLTDKVALPATLSPELATLVDKPPPLPQEWLFEIKFDGYRILARVDGKDVQLFTRNGNDWTGKLMPLHAALVKMKLPSGWYDGEIVVHDSNGRPDFGMLQQSFDNEKTNDIVYFVFDAPYLDGYDLRALPLEQRRELLGTVMQKHDAGMVRFSPELEAPPAEMVTAACKMGLEGIIGKRRDSAYTSRRSGDWIKLKCGQRQEFVIGGYTDPQGARTGIGSLLLGTHDGKGKAGKLRYAGNVGSGFNVESLGALRAKLDALAADESPFEAVRGIARKAHWVKPTLVAEVSFGEWTRGGSIRHAVFHGLRTDKPPRAITREQPAHVEDLAYPEPEQAGRKPGRKSAASKKRADVDVDAGGGASTISGAARSGSGKRQGTAAISHENTGDSARKSGKKTGTLHGKLPDTLRVTNPDRVIDAGSGTLKIDLVRYYALVGELMMAHLKARPVSLVRAPAGVGGELFFQKHADVDKMPGLKNLDPALDPDHPPMLTVGRIEGLLSAAQWNVVEMHTQNAVARNYEKPNRIVFDLDPGKGVDWPAIQQAAELMHAFLDELGLAAFLKTSGGKGLHVVVPIKPAYDWDTVKAFSKAVVEHMAATLPDRFSVKSGQKNRVGKIYIDYLRNGRGATTVCAWSARTRPGLGISVPVRWDELPHLKGGDHWTVATVHDRLDEGNTPWDGYDSAAKSIAPAMKQLGFEG